jgi:hypothetical protein
MEAFIHIPAVQENGGFQPGQLQRGLPSYAVRGARYQYRSAFHLLETPAMSLLPKYKNDGPGTRMPIDAIPI